jgi:1,4-dihydroxy-2-naphthoate octaprenyltransferase
LPNHPDKTPLALATGLVSLAVVAAVGLFFLVVRGWGLLPLGLLGMLVIVLYTPVLTRNPWFCLVAPGLGFGILMVMGTDYALTGSYSWTAFVASLVPSFLVSDLLLLNQFPDIEADASIGRRHLLITMGRKAGVVTYALFLAGAYLTVVAGCIAGLLPWAGMIALATIALAVPTIMGTAKFNASIPDLVPFMGRNVVINIATPVLLAIGVFIGR